MTNIQEEKKKVERNLRLMQQGDDGANSQNWDTFATTHTPDVIVHMPGRLFSEATKGTEIHLKDAAEFPKIFPDMWIFNHPYLVTFGQGDWTCAVAKLAGTMKEPMTLPSGKIIPVTNKKFEVPMCTVARWIDGKIAEEWIFADQLSMMRQIGVLE
jgi:predicted ester cyclase